MTDHGALMKQALREIQSLRSALAEAKASRREPIAIIGMGCRFPGGANDPDAYWRLLASGTDAITEVPRTRWDVDAFYDADSDAPGKMYTRHGGFLADVDRFDAQFFGVSPLDATNMDPQQRLLLEVAWEAFEHAGHVPGAVARTGVYVGSFMDDYLQLNFHASDPRAIDAYNTLGLLRGLAAGRLAYTLDLHGPAMQLDTACSSSLLATHLAVQALRNRECDMALAGGVNLILVPEVTIGLCRMKAMAADGRCKSFDARADGYVRGEGCGIVVLKRLADAIADSDSIYAVIRGSAVNHDGRSNGLTAPNGSAQKMVIRHALADAGVAPDQIQLVEAHGTGTSLGDPIEAMALGEVLCHQRKDRLLLGSVKSNFGHLESAAGAAALMKVALALHHGAVPPSLHFEQPNPHIPWERLPITVPTRVVDWPSAPSRMAGISSFGMSGTNVHMIVEQAPEVPVLPAEDGAYVLTISAATEEALDALTSAYETHLEATNLSPRDLCHTSNVGRRHFEHRRAVAGQSREELARKLRERPVRTQNRKRPSIAFVFPGQGSRVAATQQNIQSTLYAYQVELAQRWISWGVVPDMVLGHSVGEYAAAAIAGVFTVDDGLQLIRERERLMHGLRERGTMAAVFADEPRVLAAIRDTGLAIAAYNGSHLVISGAADAVRDASERLRASGIDVRPLEVANAFHSSLMDSMLEPFEQAVSRVPLRTPSTTFVSALTGNVARAELTNASYWRRHVREPVRFAEAARRLDAGIVLEIGPGSTLLNMVRHTIDDRAPELLQGSRIEESLAVLYECGVGIDWPTTPKRGTRVALPTYPFQRKRYWVEQKTRADRRTSKRIAVPFSEDAHFEWLVTGESFADHALDDHVVVPAATYIAMGLESIDGARGLRDVSFPQSLSMPLDVPLDRARTLRLIAGASGFRFASLRDEEQPHRDTSWVTHCSGGIERDAAAFERVDRTALLARHGQEHAPAKSGDAGFAIGPSFRRTQSVREGDREVLCRMTESDTLGAGLDAGFLDACLRTLALCIRDGGTYVPVHIASLRVAQGQGTWCHARATELTDGRIVGEVRLFDDDGNVAMEVLGLDARRIASAKSDALLEIQWQPLVPQRKRDARWLAQRPELASLLQRHGELVVEEDPTDILCDARDGAALLEIAQSSSSARVWVLTRNTQAVHPTDRIDPTDAWAWGLGKVVSMESPRLRWTTVDVDDDSGAFLEQGTGTNETAIAIRGGTCWVPRLVRKTIEVKTIDVTEAPLFRRDATYLVTGAFGAIGRRLTRWMIGEGARNLVLTGRTPTDVETPDTNVLTIAADVSDGDAVARLFEQAAASMPPIRGIFHAAGTLDDALLADLTWDRFEGVFRAKVEGTRNLHHQSLALDLDHFVCFSSAASLIGSRGQANYAAANAFVDSLAHHRRRLGYPALSVNWSAWAGDGMATHEHERLRAFGFDPIAPADALELLGRLMRSGATQIGVVPADWPKVLSALFDDPPPFFSALVEKNAPPPRERFLPALERTPVDERRRKLEEHLRALIVATIGRDPFPTASNDVSFFELGMDSLMSLDLRNRLQTDLDRTLPSTVAFEYPSIPELADYLIGSVLPAEWFRADPEPAVAPR
jgi:acyl transferase domain-containing protein/acyl carrier protein